MRVLAVDPGGTTGVASYTSGDLRTDGEAIFWSKEIPGGSDGMRAWWRGVEESSKVGLDAIIAERFTINAGTHKKSPQPDALYIIGGLQWTLPSPLEWLGEFVLQTPAEAKRFATDEKLKAVGWHRPSPGGHQNDAARHLLTYLARKRYMPILSRII